MNETLLKAARKALEQAGSVVAFPIKFEHAGGCYMIYILQMEDDGLLKLIDEFDEAYWLYELLGEAAPVCDVRAETIHAT